jgi:ribosomal protein S18 acetylase RimI-like enzyme
MTHGDVPAGMAMTQIGEDFAEILLAGIAKNFQAKGLYQQLLQYVATDLRHKEMDKFVISTQSGNTNVQKAWARYGLLPALSIQTVHIERK